MKKKLLAIIVLLIVIALPTGYLSRFDSLVWYTWHTYINDKGKKSAFHLGRYKVSIDGEEIPGITDASGLTFHTPSGTLFTVLNSEPAIVQLSSKGELIRKIRVEGVADMEGITFVRNNQFLIVEESKGRLTLINIEDGQDSIDVSRMPSLSLNFDPGTNKNFEGISWDSSNDRILVVNEKSPKRLLEIKGLLKDAGDTNNRIAITDLGKSYSFINSLHDLASLSYHEESGHLLLLSEESKLIKEYDMRGHALSAMLLWKGFHGLKERVPQAEGIAVGPDRSLYVISEPNLFYVFQPGQK